MLGISLMFLILFRNFILSIIGVVPNFMAALFILGIIGMLEDSIRYDDHNDRSNN